MHRARSPETCSFVSRRRHAPRPALGTRDHAEARCYERAHTAPARCQHKGHPRLPGARRRVPLPGGPSRRAGVCAARRPRAGVPGAHRGGRLELRRLAIRARPGARGSSRAVSRRRREQAHRVLGAAARPEPLHVEEFGSAVPAAGALRPAPGVYDIVRFRQPDQGRSGDVPLASRFWIDDVVPRRQPSHAWHGTERRADQAPGRRLGARASTPGSIAATLDGTTTRARLIGSEIRIRPQASAPGAPAPRQPRRLSGDAEQRERHPHPPEHARREHRRDDRGASNRRQSRPRRGVVGARRCDYRMPVATRTSSPSRGWSRPGRHRDRERQPPPAGPPAPLLPRERWHAAPTRLTAAG